MSRKSPNRRRGEKSLVEMDVRVYLVRDDQASHQFARRRHLLKSDPGAQISATNSDPGVTATMSDGLSLPRLDRGSAATAGDNAPALTRPEAAGDNVMASPH